MNPFVRTVIFSIFTLIALCAFAQKENTLIIEGRMDVETGRLDGKMEVLKNGSRVRTSKLSGRGKFEQELDPNANYIFEFSQEGYVTKRIQVDTKIKHDRGPDAYPFLPFKFEVTLFEQYEGVNTVVFNQPVAKIAYDPETDDFTYDTDYSKSISEQIAIAEKETEKAKKVAEKAAKEEEKAAQEKPKEEPKKEVVVKEDPPPREEPVEKKDPPVIKETTTVKKAGPTTTPRRRTSSPPPTPPKRTGSGVVVLHSYTVGELNYPNLNAYGYINFGDGAGNREITKEQFDEYKKIYH